MLPIFSFLIALFFLIGTFFLTALASSFRKVSPRDLKKPFASAGSLFFYRPFHLFFFPENEYESLYFATVCAQNIARYCYAGASLVFLFATPLFQSAWAHYTGEQYGSSEFIWFWIALISFVFLFISFFIGDFLPKILGTRHPEAVFRFCTPFASIFMFLAFPITYPFLKISQYFSKTIYYDHLHEPAAITKQEIIDIIQEADLSPDDGGINRHDKKLIESVLSFRERIAREVMVPRVDMFSLSANTTIKEAAELIAKEGYSRTPIFRGTVDNIIGVLMYKDVLAKFQDYEKSGNDPKILDESIESLKKNVLYTPETKKISSLLQEFRKTKVHLAIVVDEYGGTEGIVTIEDLLEEIVGDIADEYDQEESLYIKNPDGSWTIDATMSIYDVEKLLDIDIPEEGDYDTLGGYVYHYAGTIPKKGFVIHQDEFELEIISSNERAIEEVKITPILTENEHNDTESDDHTD